MQFRNSYQKMIRIRVPESCHMYDLSIERRKITITKTIITHKMSGRTTVMSRMKYGTMR